MKLTATLAALSCVPAAVYGAGTNTKGSSFHLMETTIDQVHAAMKARKLTAHELVQQYLDRIDAYDKRGPNINCVITLNPKAMEEADKLDAKFKQSGFVGPLHGI